jgi:hypothetical protein
MEASFMKHTRVLFAAVFASLVLVSACSSLRHPSVPKHVTSIPPQSRTENGITVDISHVQEKTLNEKFGKTNNPFVEPPSLLHLNKIMVFDVRIHVEDRRTEDHSGAIFILGEVELQHGGKVIHPENRFHLYNFWENLINRDDDFKSWNKGRVKNLIKDTLFQNETTVQKGSTAEGFVVFMGNLPKYGKGELYIPLFFENGQKEAVFRFAFDF